MMELKLGKYRHFKGKDYQVLGVVLDSETKEEMVLYKAMYGKELTWVRPLKVFTEHVERGNYSGPRFQYVEKADVFEGLPFPITSYDLTNEQILASLACCQYTDCDQCVMKDIAHERCIGELIMEAHRRMRKLMKQEEADE